MYEDNRKIYFVNEMCQGGTLYERVAREQSFSEVKTAKIVRQMISAVTYLHSKNIVHGDIKPQNIHFRGVNDNMIKIIDFGTSRRINEQHAMHGVFGTSYYLAPEVIEGVYSEKCDVWSMGVIMYILLCGEPPFNAATDQEVVELIKIGEFSMEGEQWDHVTDEAKNLIASMLTREEHRLSSQEAFHHPWFERCHSDDEADTDTHQQVHRALDNLRTFSSKHKVKQAALGYLI